MKYIYNVAKVSLLLSISTIFIKKWAILGSQLKISDIFLLISFTAIIILISKKKVVIDKNIIKSIKYIGILFFILSIGTTMSLIFFHQLPYKEIIVSYTRIIVNCLIFLEIILLGGENKHFLEQVIFSFLLSLIVIPMAYIFPILIQNGLLLDSSHYRFAGLFNDPNYYANFSIIPTIVLLFLFIKENRLFFKIIFFFCFALSLGFLIWTGSRSGWIGIIIALISFIFFEFRSKGYKKSLLTSFFILIALGIGFFLTPNVAQKQIKERAQVFIPRGEVSIMSTKTTSIFPHISLTNGQDRWSIWKQSLIDFSKNPLGYGPSYNSIINLNNNGPHGASHNIILESMLIGGVPLIFLYLLLILNNKNDYIKFYKKNNYFLVSIILGILASSFFIDSFESRWIWIIIAIIIITQKSKAILFENLYNE